MPWTVTLEIADCGALSTKLSGAAVLDGTTSTTLLTDANGRVSYTKDDSLSSFIVKVTLHAFIGINKSLNKTQNNTIQSACLAHLPEGTDPDNPDTPTGHGGNSAGGCFIVSAATGSAESAEVRRLRQLRDRVAAVSRLGDQLVDLIYRDYVQFSPPIAVELEQDPIARQIARCAIVRPLLAWYSLAGVLAFEHADAKAVQHATDELLSACPKDFAGASMMTLLDAIGAGTMFPPDSYPLLAKFAPRLQAATRLRFGSWAILDPLRRLWRSATHGVDLADQVAEWLAAAPLEALAPPSDPHVGDMEFEVLAGFFDFKPTARFKLGDRLRAAWPDAAGALERTGFISQKAGNE